MTVHQRLGVAVLLVGIVGIVIAGFGVARGTPGPTLRAYLALTSALIGVQVVIGGILFLRGYRPAESLHYLYGGLLLVALPVARGLGAGPDDRREAWYLLGGCVVLTGLATRAIVTGGG